jgi:hypothetical protein
VTYQPAPKNETGSSDRFGVNWYVLIDFIGGLSSIISFGNRLIERSDKLLEVRIRGGQVLSAAR